eukprot:4258038-Pleurochrysis_carterae.AAC.1
MRERVRRARLRDPLRDGERHPVRPERAHDHELVEARESLPLLRQRLCLRLLVLGPLLPPLPRALDVGRERGELLDRAERLHRAPRRVGQPGRERVLLGVVARVLDERHQVAHRECRVALVVLAPLQHLDRELRREDDAVAFEQAARHKREERVGDRVLQVVDALVELLACLRLVERLKVDECAAVGVGAVGLEGVRHLLFRLLGDQHLLVDLGHRLLGHLERDDELLVGEDVALGRGEQEEQIVFELLELDRKLVLLGDELTLLGEQVGPLLAHHGREQLVFQALLGHGEVDER